MVLDAGALMLDRRMLEQDATAEEIEAYSVTVQVVPPLPATELCTGTTAWVVTAAAAEVDTGTRIGVVWKVVGIAEVRVAATAGALPYIGSVKES